MSRYRFAHNKVMCDVFEPSGPTRNVSLFLYGFPAMIGPNKMTDLLVSHGFVVLQPHYPGTYDSAGTFDPFSAADAVATIVEAIRDGKVQDLRSNKTRHISPAITACVGYCFGCNVALRSLPVLTHLRSLILASPALTIGPATVSSGFVAYGPPLLEYVKRSRPYTYRLGKLGKWMQLYDGHLNQPTGKCPSSLRTVLGLAGAEDERFDHSVLKQNSHTIIKRFVGDQATVSFLFIPGADHRIDSLLDKDARLAVLQALG